MIHRPGQNAAQVFDTVVIGHGAPCEGALRQVARIGAKPVRAAQFEDVKRGLSARALLRACDRLHGLRRPPDLDCPRCAGPRRGRQGSRHLSDYGRSRGRAPRAVRGRHAQRGRTTSRHSSAGPILNRLIATLSAVCSSGASTSPTNAAGSRITCQVFFSLTGRHDTHKHPNRGLPPELPPDYRVRDRTTRHRQTPLDMETRAKWYVSARAACDGTAETGLANRRLQPLGHLSELVFSTTWATADLGSRPGRIWLPNCYPRPVESRPIDRRVGVAVVDCQHVGVDRRPGAGPRFARRYRAPPPFGDAAFGATSGMSGQLRRVRSYQQQKPG